MRARIAANTRWANASAAERSAQAEKLNSGRLKRFELAIDPDGKLPPEERAARAKNAQAAHMQRMALKSSQARRARRAQAGAELGESA